MILGIFAYLNFLTPKLREEIIQILISGLRSLEYRGYDSAGCLIKKQLAHVKVNIFDKCLK